VKVVCAASKKGGVDHSEREIELPTQWQKVEKVKKRERKREREREREKLVMGTRTRTVSKSGTDRTIASRVTVEKE
jgi:hypothetical protein